MIENLYSETWALKAFQTYKDLQEGKKVDEELDS